MESMEFLLDEMARVLESDDDTARMVIQRSHKKRLAALTLSDEAAKMIEACAEIRKRGIHIPMESVYAEKLVASILSESKKFSEAEIPVLIVPSSIKETLRRITSRFIPGLVFLSHDEIGPGTEIKSLGEVKI